MSTGIAIIVLLVICAAGYGGYSAGLFESLYGVVREMSAFIIAITFGLPLSDLLVDMMGTQYLSEDYYELIGFFALILGVFALVRWLRTGFTIPVIRCVPGLNEGGGALVGALHGVVITGIILIGWSMLPVAKYIPSDAGRLNPPAALDTGSLLLKSYGLVAEAMGGNDYVVYGEPLKSDKNNDGQVDDGEFEDLNGNGEWDVGLLWHYRHYADIRPEDISEGIVFRPDKESGPELVNEARSDSSPSPS